MSGKEERVAELERVLASVSVVDPPDAPSKEIAFGSTVTVETPEGTLQTYTIVGVDELQSEPDAVSWVSPIGKALLAANIGDRVVIDDKRFGRILSVNYRP